MEEEAQLHHSSRVKLKARKDLSDEQSERSSQRERSSSSFQDQDLTRNTMSIVNEPTWADIASLRSGGSGIPVEVDVPSEAPTRRSGDFGDDVPAMGETRNSGSHRTPSMGDPEVDVDWVLASEPRRRPPPAPPGTDGASLLRSVKSDKPDSAFGGFQGFQSANFRNAPGFDNGTTPRRPTRAPNVQTVDSKSRSGIGYEECDDDEEEDHKREEEVEQMTKVKTVVDLAPSTHKVKKPTSRRSSMYGLNQEAIIQCNQAGGKLFPPLKDETSAYGNVTIAHAHVGIAQIGSHPIYCNGPTSRTTFVLPPTQEVHLGGEAIELSDKPLATTMENFMPLQRWLTSEREELKASAREAFHKSMVANILGKNNKLEIMVIKVNSPQLLKSVKNLQVQLEAIAAHLHSHDCAQVMTVVIPIDVYKSPAIHEKTYNVLHDYATLHVAMVANGTTWIQNWIKSKATRENIALTLEFLRNNTGVELWGKAYEEHQEYRAYQQGGPLMLFLIMKRILDVSEASILALVLRIKEMKLSKMPGEDVEEAVSMIKATIKVLVQCSTDVRNFVPDDIEVLVLKVFQTSSLKEFNEIFEREERDARAKADKYGGLASYPSVQETCQLASNTFKRLCGPGSDYKWVSKAKQGALVTHTTGSGDRKCFNCGKVGCIPSTCDQPRDEARIKKAAEAWRKEHPLKADTVQKKRDGPGGRRRGKT